MMEVSWELRSGDWEFEVPFLEPGHDINNSTVSAGYGLGVNSVLTKSWQEYVGNAFMNSSDQAYTGHYTAYGHPFYNLDTQQNCSLKEGQSKLDKIYDYQLSLNKETASYNKLKNAGEGPEIKMTPSK